MRAFAVVSAISLSLASDTASLLQHKQLSQHKHGKFQCSKIKFKGKRGELSAKKREKREKRCLKKGCIILNAAECVDSTAEQCPYGSKCQTKELTSGYCQNGDDPVCGPVKDKYNCFTKEVWSEDKKEWCCKNKKLGCPPPCGPVCAIACEKGNVMDEQGCPTCNCKGNACSTRDDKFCPVGLCPAPPAGCTEGKKELVWNNASKCCEKDLCPLICEDEYDCTTREKWTPDKTEWCCKNKNLGCKPTCPPKCEKHCLKGNVIDENGCETCECIGDSCGPKPKGPCPVPGCLELPKNCKRGDTELIWHKGFDFLSQDPPPSTCCAKDLCPKNCSGSCTEEDNKLYRSVCPVARCAPPKKNCVDKQQPDYEWDADNNCCPQLCQRECPPGKICPYGC